MILKPCAEVIAQTALLPHTASWIQCAGSARVQTLWLTFDSPVLNQLHWLSACLSVCSSICLSVCLSVWLSIYLPFYLFILWNSNIVKSHTFQASHLWTVPNFTYFPGIKQFWSVPLGCWCSPIWMMEWHSYLIFIFFFRSHVQRIMENWYIIPLMYHF